MDGMGKAVLQTELFGPANGLQAILDAQFLVNVLGMEPDSVQRDDQRLRNLRPAQFRFEQTQDFQLAAAQRLTIRLPARLRSLNRPGIELP